MAPLAKLIGNIFSSKHERDVKRYLPYVEQINALEPSISSLSNDELAAKTAYFREKLDEIFQNYNCFA